jgi:hypothetical protein
VIFEGGGKGKGRTQSKGLDHDVKLALARATGAAPEAGKRLPQSTITVIGRPLAGLLLNDGLGARFDEVQVDRDLS